MVERDRRQRPEIDVRRLGVERLALGLVGLAAGLRQNRVEFLVAELVDVLRAGTAEIRDQRRVRIGATAPVADIGFEITVEVALNRRGGLQRQQFYLEAGLARP